MVWVSLLIAVVQLVVKLPEIVGVLRDIFELFRTKPLRASYEAKKLLKACETKLKQAYDGTVEQSFDCPIAAYHADLRERLGIIS